MPSTWPGDEMAAQFVAEPQRAFEIDRVPGCQAPRVVRLSVSAEAVTANQPSPFSTTVRQRPEQAIEAPSAIEPSSRAVAISQPRIARRGSDARARGRHR